MPPDPIERLNVLPLTDDSFGREDVVRSKLFGDEFDRAIIGTTVNENRRRVLIYDEETLVDLMLEQIREGTSAGETVLREDAASWISGVLIQAESDLGEWMPVVI